MEKKKIEGENATTEKMMQEREESKDNICIV